MAKKSSFADIENISIAGQIGRMGPIGLHLYAEKYLIAAKALPAPGHTESTPPRELFEPVRPYLVCHSIELALKAFLSLKGQKMADMKFQVGHQLTSILADADSQGLASQVAITSDQRTAIRDATAYYAGKVFEYPAVGEALFAYPSMPPLSLLMEAATALIDALRQPCHEAN
jgi:hypothetical protein